MLYFECWYPQQKKQATTMENGFKLVFSQKRVIQVGFIAEALSEGQELVSLPFSRP